MFKKGIAVFLFAVLMSGGLCLAAHPTGSSPAAAAEPYAAYVMGYFTETPQGTGNAWSLHLAYSTDGLEWVPLNQNNPVLVPTLGEKGLRDPFIFRKQDGKFVILATNMYGNTNFGFASPYIHAWDSDDLIAFRNARLLRLHNTGMHTWAPEAFYDPDKGQYGIIWSGNTDYNRIYVNYTTDFVNVSSHQVFFDPGHNVLDATVHAYNGMYYLYYKNENTGKLFGTRSSSLTPRSFDSNTYTGPLGSTTIEAPIVVKKLNENRWYLYGDSYIPVNGEFYAWETANIGAGAWTELNKRNYNQPLNSKHASVVPVTQTELNNLIARWGNPSWNRLKSYNYPDYYVRHANFAARIDPYPFDPYRDSQWKLVPGLADAGGVSFESVNYPGYFLRHKNYALVLEQNDGSAQFGEDATFYKENGLADSSWSSFRSYNTPDRYIRHYNYNLRIDPISTSTDRQDATFKIVY